MRNQIITEYTYQGLSRLAKESLVEIISNLQNMQTELGIKISEHIPIFLDTCDNVLKSTDTLYKEAVEQSERLAQREIDILERKIEHYKNEAAKAESPEEKEKYERKVDETMNKIAAARTNVIEERNALIRDRSMFCGVILFLMAGTLGVSIKTGKFPLLRK